ncbi:MAG TPA: ATP-dependent DNA helicase, partial [Patescibacteria group bacterium]|nr:ATP-dependent DNA helicase [Patescibacteria group bacterium]
VLTLPLFRLEVQEIADVLQYAQKKALSLFASLEALTAGAAPISAAARRGLDGLLRQLRGHHQLAQQKSAAEVFVQIIRDLKFADRLEEDTQENAENRELIEQFYKKIESFESENADKSLHSFLRQLDLEQQAGDQGKINFDPNLGPESLKVLTVHSAKGLEFETVFVINLVDKRFPSVSKRDSIEIPPALVKDILPEGDFHLQEERRLFYVALTRAKKNLFLTWARDYGGKQAKKPSQFLVEAGLVPGEKLSRATGKVVFTKPITAGPAVFQLLPDKFSYSQLKDFETCPLKYKYQYYLKLPVPGSHYLSFGNTMHKVFEEFLRQFKDSRNFSQQDLFGKSRLKPRLPGFEILEKLYEKNWIDEWYPSARERASYFKQGQDMLKQFYEECQAHLPDPKYIEQSFILFLDKYRLVGRIDRADQTPQGLIIYDYKTGRAPKKNEKRDIDQLYIYQWAAQEHLKEKVAALRYWYLKEPEPFLEEPLASPEELQQLKGELFQLIEKIINTIKYDRFKEEHSLVRDHKCDYEDLE